MTDDASAEMAHARAGDGDPLAAGEEETVDGVPVLEQDPVPTATASHVPTAPVDTAPARLSAVASPAVAAAAAAATGFVAGAATLALVRRHSARKLARAAVRPRRGATGLPIVGSRSFLIDVHLIGKPGE